MLYYLSKIGQYTIYYTFLPNFNSLYTNLGLSFDIKKINITFVAQKGVATFL